MRVTALLFVITGLMALLLWVSLSGFWFIIGLLIWLVFIVISVGYRDTAILFFLGAREVKSIEENKFYAAAIQEAYKLAVPQPRLYFYNGTLERAFVLQNRKDIALVVSKELLENCSQEELSAICFELLLQVKKNLAAKRTKVMFLIGIASWFFYGVVEIFVKVLPFKEVRLSVTWLIYYLINPWLEFVFKFTIGANYFRKLENYLKDYPLENNLISKLVSKLTRPEEIYSQSLRKLIEVSALNKSRHYRSIIALEFLPHEWDIIFDTKSGKRV